MGQESSVQAVKSRVFIIRKPMITCTCVDVPKNIFGDPDKMITDQSKYAVEIVDGQALVKFSMTGDRSVIRKADPSWVGLAIHWIDASDPGAKEECEKSILFDGDKAEIKPDASSLSLKVKKVL